jgi:pimeloyl-ACP methyl ester carboxylesterase
MFVITNRVLDESRSDLRVFGREPNPSGPNELRMVNVEGRRDFRVTVLDDQLDPAEVARLAQRFNLDIDTTKPWFASLRVACELFDQAFKACKHVLVYVHGYNNDMRDVLRTARALEALYDVIVVPFSWPANGGGQVSGTLAYLNDKDDARSSATALHRAIEKVGFYHGKLTEGIQRDLLKRAHERHPDDHDRARMLFTTLLERQCQSTLNLMCHSMGNYVLKYATLPSGSSLRQLCFDNIALVAADANNPDHETWVERLPTRNRLYVVINENDYALKWSRRKPGEEQKERLGHHLRNLVARNAYYLDVTRSRGVGNQHGYFHGRAVTENATLARMFRRVLEGGKAETSMTFHADLNVYRT